MKTFVYASRIKEGKTQCVIEHKKSKSTADFPTPFWGEIGLYSWHCWLQQMQGQDYLIHLLQGESLEAIFSGLRREIANQNLVATGLRSFYLETLGRDYAKEEAMPHLEEILHIKSEDQIVSNNTVNAASLFMRAYIYPLLPGKIQDHIAYSTKAASSNLELTLRRLKASGVVLMQKWIQYGPTGPYIVHLQHRLSAMPDKRLFKKNALLFEGIPTMLSEHTGLCEEELIPSITPLLKGECHLQKES